MHVKIFDCDIFIDSHKISVSDNNGQESFFVPEKRLIEHPLPKDAIY